MGREREHREPLLADADGRAVIGRYSLTLVGALGGHGKTTFAGGHPQVPGADEANGPEQDRPWWLNTHPRKEATKEALGEAREGAEAANGVRPGRGVVHLPREQSEVERDYLAEVLAAPGGRDVADRAVDRRQVGGRRDRRRLDDG